MLSRHAENLFWIGRYVERAEDTARLLDVTYHGVLEAASERPPEVQWRELLETLLLDDEVSDADTAGDRVGSLLIADREFPGSVTSMIGMARENARTTREWLSVEVWEALNDLHLEVRNMDLGRLTRDQPYEVLQRVRSGCQAVIGAVDSSMHRSEGYRFLIAGQRLERALITTRVLAVWQRRLGEFGTQAAFAEWVRLLKSVSAYEAYLRIHRASMDGRRVLQFLLRDTDFPRSVLHCVALIERLLTEIGRDRQPADLRRAVGQVRSAVEFVDPDVEGADLGRFLAEVEAGLLTVSDEVEAVYFRPRAASLMHSFETF
ncbi:MAG: alpha-E domain-containing protein [Acidimicrobiia bacterium]|nr:MAG: alpha-E domain-containing protein [Acidimicrobiia bacterium]